MTANDGVLIELDARNRASLGRLARHRRYLAKLELDGTIVLTPAAVVPASAWSEVAPGLYVAPLGTPEPADDLAGQPPADVAEHARVEAEKLPTVGRWPDGGHLSECATRVYPDHSYRCTCAPSTRESYE